jgi:hypothetical protein
MRWVFLVSAMLLALQPLNGYAQAKTVQGGPHDFDFELGMWNVRISKLVHSKTGASSWIKMSGTHEVRPLWHGRANVGVLEIDGPAGHVEGMQLRLYNPQSHTWALSFASSRDGTLGQPSVGGFQNGRGEFYDRTSENGRVIYERSITKDIMPDSYRDEGATSSDGGKTWVVNWIALYTRAKEK